MRSAGGLSAFGVEHGVVSKAFGENKGRLQSALASAAPGTPAHSYAQSRLLAGNVGSRVGAVPASPSGSGGKRAKPRTRDVRAYARQVNARSAQVEGAGMHATLARSAGEGKSNMREGLKAAAPNAPRAAGGAKAARGLSRGGKLGLAAGGAGLLGAGAFGAGRMGGDSKKLSQYR